MVKEITIQNYLPGTGAREVYEEIITGLTSRQKYIPPKYFYDKTGSELFEEITRLKEYYPTRTEKRILRNIMDIIRIDLRELSIVELGSGDPSKISLLFKQIPEDILETINYYPVDICEEEIIRSVDELTCTFSLNSITGIVADFHHQLHVIPKKRCRLFCFFGSTIGNFTTEEAERFLRQLEREMKPGDRLLLGVDVVKDKTIIEKAYNDSKGITARFNLNVLNVVNRILGTDFRSDDFEHLAFYNEKFDRIEMHLKALTDVRVMGRGMTAPICIRKDETIHTENSHKFTFDKIGRFCEWGRFTDYTVCYDPKEWFGMVYAIK